ncbi:MAG: dipeptidase [Oscillospiraceae bacterium]|nr:dipeptidase [Oscillospiraceae bacterium]
MNKYSIFDTHCDTLCCVFDDRKSLMENDCHADFKRMAEYKNYTQVFACFIDPVYKSCAVKRTMDLIDTFHSDNNNMPINVKGILSIEGGEGIYSLAALRNYYKLGVRIAALTWNYSNHIASGALEEDVTKGLTDFGRKVIEEMNRIGMLIDVSHLNRKSFYDIAEITSMPIIATHSCSDYICPHPRNLTDEQFKIIRDTNGCVGINFYPDFLTSNEKCGIDDIIRHIDHFMELGGENNIGIGADFDGVDCLPDGISGVQDMYKIFNRLSQLGYSDEQIEKISHKNFKRIFIVER